MHLITTTAHSPRRDSICFKVCKSFFPYRLPANSHRSYSRILRRARTGVVVDSSASGPVVYVAPRGRTAGPTTSNDTPYCRIRALDFSTQTTYYVAGVDKPGTRNYYLAIDGSGSNAEFLGSIRTLAFSEDNGAKYLWVGYVCVHLHTHHCFFLSAHIFSCALYSNH